MPKVSEQYRQDRRDLILAAAARCFLRNGFHQTSLQDVFAESGLSAGAVYRYFPSKDELILAIAQDNLRLIRTTIGDALSSTAGTDITAALAAAARTILDRDEHDRFASMALLVWSESLRNAALREELAHALAALKRDLESMLRRGDDGSGLTPAEVSGLASVAVSVLPGTILQAALLPREAVAELPDALRALPAHLIPTASARPA